MTPSEYTTFKASMIANAELYATQATTWHKLANSVAGYSPRSATFLREHAASLEALAALGKGLSRD